VKSKTGGTGLRAIHRRLARGDARPGDAWLQALLAPPALLYGLGTAARNLAFDRGLLASRRCPVPAVGVGGVCAGGSGKTPIAADIARRLHGWGLRPLLVTRGYGAPRASGRATLVSAGDRPLLGWQEAGDEALLFARLAPGIPIATAVRREEALVPARQAGLDPGVLVLDGVLQHRRLIADFLVVSVDASRRPGAGHLLPWGDRRESWRALRRADLVVLYRIERCADPRAWEAFVAHHAPGVPIAHAANVWREPYRLADAEGNAHAVDSMAAEGSWEALSRARVGVWLSIADPQPFLRQLAAHAVRPRRIECARDHAPFGEREAQRLVGRAGELDAVVVSEKDAVKIGEALKALPPVWVVPARIEWTQGEDALDAGLKARLRARGTASKAVASR